MINELSTAQRPAQPINTAQMRGGGGAGDGGAASLRTGLEAGYELLLGYGMRVGLCHRERVQVEVKCRGGRTLVVNISDSLSIMSINIIVICVWYLKLLMKVDGVRLSVSLSEHKMAPLIPKKRCDVTGQM